MRKPIIAGNWKMNKTIDEGLAFIDDIKARVKDTDVEVMLFVPYTLLKTMKDYTKGSNIIIGSQNVYFEDQGAFTGEISPLMLKDVGIKHTLVGHSERRQYFNETDEIVNKKILKAIEHEIDVIVCVGEKLEEREAHREAEVVRTQIAGAFKNVEADVLNRIVVAYEPIWAIGTGKTASSKDANDMIAFIRSEIEKLYNEDISEEMRILYGGSVNPSNIEDLMNQDDIDGGLVGGASLKADQFVDLVNF
ncbi:MAG: triose-phosphate isomerase [Clostridiales bacterium]|nr:triose-phosphate isomerase [Clostridiales bacterium]